MHAAIRQKFPLRKHNFDTFITQPSAKPRARKHKIPSIPMKAPHSVKISRLMTASDARR